MPYMNQAMSVTFLPLHTTPLFSTGRKECTAFMPDVETVLRQDCKNGRRDKRGPVTVHTFRNKFTGKLSNRCSNTAELAKGAHVQYRMKPTDSPIMMPMTAGIGMELTGKPALTPAMKTTASKPSLSVVVKAKTQIPHLPDLAFNCMIIGKDKRQSLVEGCMCSMPTMVLSLTMLLWSDSKQCP